jgi:hypothetical protein
MRRKWRRISLVGGGMKTDLIHGRRIVRVEKPTSEPQKTWVVRDAIGQACMLIHKLLSRKDVELNPDDTMTVDVRILIEHKEEE